MSPAPGTGRPRLPADMQHQPGDPLAELVTDDLAPVLFAFDRYRWVGQYAVKADLRSAMRARERLGGAVEHAFAVLLTDGTEILTRWTPLLPALEPAPKRADSGQPADLQDPPTGAHTDG